MGDALLARMWVDNHQRMSEDLQSKADEPEALAERRDEDMLPIVARVLALVLAVSLSSLTLGAAIA